MSEGEIYVDCADLRLLWEYSTWANGQILAAAGRLPPTALRKLLASGHGTLFGTLLHALDTEYGCRMLVEQGMETPLLTEQKIPDLPAMAERFATEAAAMRDYLAALTDRGLAEPLRYTAEDQQRGLVPGSAGSGVAVEATVAVGSGVAVAAGASVGVAGTDVTAATS